MQSENVSTHDRRAQKGYNLVEVMIATALLGVVILSIVTLFFIGKRNVYSGKQMSAANAVATRVLEDLALMSATDVLTNFNITDDTALTSNNVGGTDYAGSVLRDTRATIDSNNDPSGYLTRWKALVDSTTNFAYKGRVVLVITPANPIDNDEPVTTAQVVRVRGFVEWNEGIRPRRVPFEASKLQRP